MCLRFLIVVLQSVCMLYVWVCCRSLPLINWQECCSLYYSVDTCCVLSITLYSIDTCCVLSITLYSIDTCCALENHGQQSYCTLKTTQTYILFAAVCLVPVSMAASAAYIPGVSLADKLRLAASKGQTDKIRELLSSGATFEPDRVCIILYLVSTHFTFLIYHLLH